MAERNLILTKESNQNEIKSYFSAILELSKSDNEFPINLDEVWMLVYTRKSDAVEALQNSSFIEGVDYQVLRKNPQNPNGGRPTVDYYLTVSCLEFFIARRIRPVFEVYRKVFHGAAKMVQKELSRKELLQMALEAEEEKERLMLENKQQQAQIEADAPRVRFSQAVETADKSILIGELAKILRQNGVEMGERRLFEWMRKNGYLCSHGERYNQPTQRAMEMGLFELKKTTINKPDGTVLVTTTTKVTGKGQIYFVDKFLRSAA